LICRHSHHSRMINRILKEAACAKRKQHVEKKETLLK